MEKEIFKVGDTVYSIEYGWGIVSHICEDVGEWFPIHVKFFSYQSEELYTKDGRIAPSHPKQLSFTEYTLQGFSQERPIELPEVGELCLVRDNDNCSWLVRNFKSFDKSSDYPFETINGGEFKQMKRIKILDESKYLTNHYHDAKYL